MKSFKTLSILLVVAGIAMTANAGAITLKQGVLGDVADRCLETWYGNSPRPVGNDLFLRSVGSVAEPAELGVFGFTDLFSQVPGTSGGDVIQIDSATLTLTTTIAGGVGQTVSVSRITVPWLSVGLTEATVDSTGWSTGTQSDGTTGDVFHPGKDTDYANKASVTWAGGWNTVNTFDVTAMVQAIYGAGTNDGFAVYQENAAGADYAGVESSETTKGPQLVIEYSYVPVPEPMTMGLLLVGGLGMLARKRR